MKQIRFFAEGIPKGQPRPRGTHVGGYTRVYNPTTTKQWKGQITLAAMPYINAGGEMTGPVKVVLHFRMPRPKKHFRTGKHEGKIKEDAPRIHTGKPDTDNLAKPILDALTKAGMWKDDSQVADLYVSKRYADVLTGCEVVISEVEV